MYRTEEINTALVAKPSYIHQGSWIQAPASHLFGSCATVCPSEATSPCRAKMDNFTVKLIYDRCYWLREALLFFKDTEVIGKWSRPWRNRVGACAEFLEKQAFGLICIKLRFWTWRDLQSDKKKRKTPSEHSTVWSCSGSSCGNGAAKSFHINNDKNTTVSRSLTTEMSQESLTT